MKKLAGAGSNESSLQFAAAMHIHHKSCRALLCVVLFLLAQTCFAATARWDLFEVSLKAEAQGNPFKDVTLTARFTNGQNHIDVTGFYDGDGVYRIRFMPPSTGTWKYESHSNLKSLDHQTGEFACDELAATNHGPVRVHNTYHFAYADGTPFKPITTTSYGWVCQPDAMEDQTIQTLSKSPFNKLRMSVLPIPYAASKDQLELFPFEQDSDGKADFDRFNPKFFQHLDRRIAQLRDLNIEADLILFTPYYNKLHFNEMTRQQDDQYVHYVVARLAAYRNVWWSLANEYDLIRNREPKDWDRIGKLIQSEDPYQHLRSIHFSRNMFDPSTPWITHMSVQNGNAVADFGRASLYRDVCPKPVVYDEVCYEGDLDRRWGQLSGEEMTLRFWMGTIAGTYVGHGEVTKAPESKSWGARGGELTGTSPARIAFLKQIIDDAPKDGIEPLDRYFEDNVGGKAGEYYLIYFGKHQPKEWTFELYKDQLRDGMQFEVDVLDTWNMTITHDPRTFRLLRHSPYTFQAQDDAKIELPGKPYMALRIRRKM